MVQASEVLKGKTGVIYGDDVYNLFKHAQSEGYAIPAINVTSSSTVVASLEAARDAKSPIILQMSQGGAAYFAGKGVDNKDQSASIQGAIAGAHYIRAIAPAYGIPVVLHTDHCAKKLLPWLDGMLDEDEKFFKANGVPLFSSHMIDLSEESKEENIETTKKYLQRAAPMKQFLEMEIGITGGEEDGVNNEDVDNNSLYTQPEDIFDIYKTLSEVSQYFSIAAGFGNVHGVYKPGNVKLRPELLQKHQQFVKEQVKSKDDKPVFLVFHGGSGSSVDDFRQAISYGVVKVNLDTDMQWAYLSGVRDYVLNKKDYLLTQVGNPDGEDKPNKKFYDPRVWVREGEKTMSQRLKVALGSIPIASTPQSNLPSLSAVPFLLSPPAALLPCLLPLRRRPGRSPTRWTPIAFRKESPSSTMNLRGFGRVFGGDAQVSQADFVKSSVRTEDCPSDGLPEFALVGRSNVGKSSLLNSLVRRKKLALTSKKPGKTQCINHFRINDSWYLVDLPGYGYASAPQELRTDWNKFTKDYFLNRSTLVSVFLLIDASIPAKPIDLDYASWLGQNQIPMTIIFTKCDKRKKKKNGGKRPEENVSDFQELISGFFQTTPPWIMTSSVTHQGRDEILLHIAQLRNYWLKH